MLQWTGGSRRKVMTSRKSTENRQKQYFEQKRRRQQTAHPQNFDSGTFRYVQQPIEHRSLDIQSLLNLSSIAAKRESAPTDGQFPSRNACLKVPAGKPTNANILIDPVEHEGPALPTIKAKEAVARWTGMYSLNRVSGIDVSVLDLLDNEGIDRNSDFNQVNEDHVAFSVDDLGKTGKETEDHLQWCPDRHFSYGFGSPSKNTSYLDLSRNTSRAPYETRHTSRAPYESRHETGSIGKDFNEAFSPRALGSTFSRGKASSIPNQETVGIWDDLEYNLGHSSKNASGCKNSFSDIYDSNAGLWDAMTSIGENFFSERDLGVDTRYNNNIQYGYPGVHASDNVHLPKKRAFAMAGLGVNISEPPTQNFRQRTSGDGWCGNLMDDPSDGLSSVSEESCSSTYNSALKDMRDNRSTSFGRTGNTMHQSSEHDRMLGQSNSNPFHRSSMNLHEKFSSDKNQSTGKGYNPFNADSDFNSFYNPESSRFDLRKESPLTVFPEPDSSIGQFCFDPSNNYGSIKVSSSRSYIETPAPHRTFKEMDSDSFTGFCKVESRIDDLPPRSHHVASFFEEISLKESADGNENCATFEIRCFQEVHFKGKPCGASNCNWAPSENGESMDDLTCKGSNELKDGVSDVESNARPSGCNKEASSSTVLESNKKHEDVHDAAETRIAILSERVGAMRIISIQQTKLVCSGAVFFSSYVYTEDAERSTGPHVAV